MTWITSMGNHGAAGVLQNAGVLVILVTTDIRINYNPDFSTAGTLNFIDLMIFCNI